MAAESAKNHCHDHLEDTRLVTRVRTIPPRSLMRTLTELPTPRIAWSPPSALTVVAGGAAATITTGGPNRFTAAQTIAASIYNSCTIPQDIPSGAQPRFFGGASFHATPEPSSLWEGFPSLLFILPRYQISRINDTYYLTTTCAQPDEQSDQFSPSFASDDHTGTAPSYQPAPPREVTTLSNTPTPDDWYDQVTAILTKIRSRQLRKVVLARSLTATLTDTVDPVSVITTLQPDHPDCYQYLIEPITNRTLVGSTPERLVARSGLTIETEALAGSIARGDDPAEDERRATTLISSPKNTHEHRLVEETIREQLMPLTSHVTTLDRDIRRLDSVQHLHTPIRARLSTQTHVLSIVDELHPTPAVGGLPLADALETIRTTETFDRGWYAGPIGWFDQFGNGEFAVAIRAAITMGSTATLFAGAGLVADSNPRDEWNEIKLKWQPVLNALHE